MENSTIVKITPARWPFSHPGEVLRGPGKFLLFFYRPGFTCFHRGEFWDPHRGIEARVLNLMDLSLVIFIIIETKHHKGIALKISTYELYNIHYDQVQILLYMYS